MDVDVCKPYTYMVEWDVETYWDLLSILDGEGEAWALLRDIADVAHAYARHLIPPVFIRGCSTSGKHDWERTCFFSAGTLDDKDKFVQQLSNLIDDHANKFLGLPMLGLAIREFISSTPIFFAFHGNLPITKERRLFYSKGTGIWCNHPYWPREAIEEWKQRWGGKLPKDWEEQLDDMNHLFEHERRTLETEARTIGRALVSDEFPDWSIDFLYGHDGNWYFIDCAIAGESFHWKGCENAGRFNRRG
jgi:hypothetical protein